MARRSGRRSKPTETLRRVRSKEWYQPRAGRRPTTPTPVSPGPRRYVPRPFGIVDTETGEILPFDSFPLKVPPVRDASGFLIAAPPALGKPPELPHRVPRHFQGDLAGRLKICLKRYIKRRMVFAGGFGGRNNRRFYRRTHASSFGC